MKEGNHTEADEWFTKAEISFFTAKDVPESGLYGAGIFQLMQGIYFFDRENLEGAVEQLTSCLSLPKQYVPISKMLYSFLPDKFRDEIKVYFYLQDNTYGRTYLSDFTSFYYQDVFKMLLQVVAGFLLVTCQKELGRYDDATKTANGLFDAVRLSMNRYIPSWCMCGISIDTILEVSSDVIFVHCYEIKLPYTM